LKLRFLSAQKDFGFALFLPLAYTYTHAREKEIDRESGRETTTALRFDSDSGFSSTARQMQDSDGFRSRCFDDTTATALGSLKIWNERILAAGAIL